MEIGRRKAKKLMENPRSNIYESEPEINLMDLPMEVLANVASYLHRKHLKNFGLASKKSFEVFELVDRKNVDLTGCSRLDEKKMLDKAKTRKYTCVNLNYCHWLSPEAILELITKESLKDLKLIECQCTPKVIVNVLKLNLRSLSISLSDEWKRFFVFIKKKPTSIPCLKSLKKLKVFHSKNDCCVEFVNFTFRYVLPYCHNLEYLKLFTLPTSTSLDMRPQLLSIVPAPVPKLKTLILDLHCHKDISGFVNNFLKLILNQKEIPLKRVFLGKSTFDVILSVNFFMGGISYLKNATFENSRVLCLSAPYPRSLSFSKLLEVDGCERMIDLTLKSSQCSKIFIENVNIPVDALAQLTEKFVTSGNTHIKEISLKGNYIEGNDKMSMKLSLLEVARKCKCLENLRITDHFRRCEISYDVLVNVKFFENLKELHLVDFSISGNHDPLPEIVKSSTRLNFLLIKKIFILKNGKIEHLLFDFLTHAKQIKYLSLDDLKITKKFGEQLSECTQLENLCVLKLNNNDDEINEYFVSNLKNLINLRVFITSCSTYIRCQFISTIIFKFKNEKKPDFYVCSSDYPGDFQPHHFTFDLARVHFRDPNLNCCY